MAQRLVPFLGYEDAAAAIDWLCSAFGATERAEARSVDASGTIAHAELDFAGSTVYLSTPDAYVASRRHRERCELERRMHDNPWVIDGLFVEVEDVEGHHARAVEGGATILRAPEEPGSAIASTPPRTSRATAGCSASAFECEAASLTDPARVTETERERAIHRLRESYARGELDEEQFEEKLTALLAVQTSAELSELLPATHPDRSVRRPSLTSTADATDLETIERHLSPDEHVEWVGKPDPTKRFTPVDRFLVPFSLLWGGFAVVWETLAISSGSPGFSVFGIPFVALGLYFIFGRLVYKANRKRRTVYAVTNRRVLAVIRGRKGDSESVAAVYLRSIPNISTSAVSGGQGSVEFGISSPMYSQYANTGLEFFARGQLASGVSFYDIEDPQGVADLVERLRAADH